MRTFLLIFSLSLASIQSHARSSEFFFRLTCDGNQIVKDNIEGELNLTHLFKAESMEFQTRERHRLQATQYNVIRDHGSKSERPYLTYLLERPFIEVDFLKLKFIVRTLSHDGSILLRAIPESVLWNPEVQWVTFDAVQYLPFKIFEKAIVSCELVYNFENEKL